MMRKGDRYEEELDRFEPEYEDGADGTPAAYDVDREPHRLSRRERRRKRRLEEKLRRLEAKNADGGADGPHEQDGSPAGEEPRRRSRFAETLMALLSGNILSRNEVSRTYPYLLFVAFLAFVYIGNIFSMQHMHRRHNALTKEVRELRTKSMTMASQRMQATRQSNIVREIEKRGLPLKESLTPNKVIPK